MSWASRFLLVASGLLTSFLVINHYAAFFVICTSFYETPSLCQMIESSRVITYVGDLEAVIKANEVRRGQK